MQTSTLISIHAHLNNTQGTYRPPLSIPSTNPSFYVVIIVFASRFLLPSLSAIRVICEARGDVNYLGKAMRGDRGYTMRACYAPFRCGFRALVLYRNSKQSVHGVNESIWDVQGEPHSPSWRAKHVALLMSYMICMYVRYCKYPWKCCRQQVQYRA